MGTGWAAIGGLLVGQMYLLFTVRKEISFGLKTFLRGMYAPLAAGVAMVSVVSAVKNAVPVTVWYVLLEYVVLGAVVYFGVLLLLNKIFKDDFYDSLLWLKKNI